jgi:putative ABC transport system permease protein
MKMSERVYRWLLRLYPADFRHEYGREMSLLFRARADAGDARTAGLATLWFQVLGDLLFHAPREHWALMKQDVRYAFRSWRRTPAIPAIALTALTLGMGANISIFSVMHAVLLRSLPVPAPERLMLLRETNIARGLEPSAVSLPDYLSWKDRARSLELAAFSGQTLTWSGADYPERLEALAPTDSFLAVLGRPLHLGRWFTADEGHQGQHRVAVLSNRSWRTRFGADPAILGRQLVLNGSPYSVIGVAPADFSVPTEPDLWVPQVIDQTNSRRVNRYLAVLGRLRPGFTREQAHAEMSAIAAGLAREFPDSNRDVRVSVTPFAESLVPEEVRTALLALFGAATVVLLIACANVANVLLSRAVARRKEIAIRAALGAGAARIARQLLTESVLLTMAGALLGVLLSGLVVTAARRLLAGIVPRIDDVGLNPAVLAFALGAGIVTGVVFGLIPVWQTRGARHLGLLHATGWGDRTPTRHRVRAVLVVGQVSLTTLLLVGAGLLIQSLVKLQRVPSGIDAESVLTAKLALTRARLPNGAAISRFLSRLTSDLQAAPGVSAAGISSAIPLSPGALTVTQVATDVGPFVTCEWRLVDEGYFRTMRVPLVRGRLFGPQDGPDAPHVFVISQQTARALYADDDPIGRRLRLENGNTGEVVGVVADVRMRNLGEPPERVVYYPPAQFGFFPLFNVVVRTEGPPETAAPLIRERLKVHDPNLAAYDVQNMRHWVERSSSLMRIRTRLVTLLGTLALLLGVIGIYGVMSYLVSQRAREFAIRVALGARPRALPLVVVAQALRFTVPGIGLGLLGALFVGSRIRGLLFEVDARDPATFAAVGIAVALVAVTASYAPARRAATADPLVVLRAE